MELFDNNDNSHRNNNRDGHTACDDHVLTKNALSESSKSSGSFQTSHSLIPMSNLSNYDIYNQLGQGTFGVVTKARQKKSGKLVALKKFIVSDKKEGFPITAFREITIMKKLKNINILQIVDMIFDPNGSFFYTVCPYISSDLNGLLNNPRINLSLPQIKCLMKQILLGINYVHQSGYIHRDIKTANILLDHSGIVKIADFGLARLFHGDVPKLPNSPPGGGKYDYTGLVVTRWYRPPELLLGDRKYTTAVDIWGIGCVFGEFFTKKPILEGQSDIHQAELIFKLLGSPTSKNFPNAHLINRHGIDLKNNYTRTLESAFQSLMSNDALNLLSGMLTLDPSKRFNAVKCLDSSFFKSQPSPCDTESLSGLEESHESDVKRFKEESKSSNPVNKIKNISSIPATKRSEMAATTNSNNSLNHSKYGMDVPTYMNRVDSTNNIPNQYKYQPRNYQSNIPPKEDAGNLPNQTTDHKSNLPRHQLNQIPKHSLDHDEYRRSKRTYNQMSHHSNQYSYAFNDGYDYNTYFNPNDYYYERKSTFKRSNYGHESYATANVTNINPNQSNTLKESLYSSTARGKDLYGSEGAGDTSSLSALTKVLMKKKKIEKEKSKDDLTQKDK